MWFALNEDRPLFAFAGIWTTFSGAGAPSPSHRKLNSHTRADCIYMARACKRRRPPPESGLPTSFDLVRDAEALLVFFFFLTLYATVFVRSFQVMKHDHFNVS